MNLMALATVLLLVFVQNSYGSVITNFNENAQGKEISLLDLFSFTHKNPMEQKDTVEQCPTIDIELLSLSQCRLTERIVLLEAEINALMEKFNLPIQSKSSFKSRNKRKNEFIRFGKRSVGDSNVIPEMLRLTRSMSPSQIPFEIRGQTENLSLKKRKNEFIRFG